MVKTLALLALSMNLEGSIVVNGGSPPPPPPPSASLTLPTIIFPCPVAPPGFQCGLAGKVNNDGTIIIENGLPPPPPPPVDILIGGECIDGKPC